MSYLSIGQLFLFSYAFNWYHIPSKDEDGLFDSAYDPKGSVLSDSLSEPVTETKIFINQETSHMLFSHASYYSKLHANRSD